MRSPQRHPLKDRGDDFYPTAVEAVHALLAIEGLPPLVWEPCCGDGAIVNVLRGRGHRVIATDLVDYGLEDSQARIDFLMETSAPLGVQAIVTNPPNKLATEFAEHAVRLCPLVMILQPLTFLGSERRTQLFERGGLARVHVIWRRLPMMHRHGWQGRKNTSQKVYAWFVWDRSHSGPTIVDRVDWKSAAAAPELVP